MPARAPAMATNETELFGTNGLHCQLKRQAILERMEPSRQCCKATNVDATTAIAESIAEESWKMKEEGT